MRQDVRDFCRKNYGEPVTTFEERNKQLEPVTISCPDSSVYHRTSYSRGSRGEEMFRFDLQVAESLRR